MTLLPNNLPASITKSFELLDSANLQSADPHNAGANATSPQTWNAYVYVSDNPLTLIDPAGMVMTGGNSDNNVFGSAKLPYDQAVQVDAMVFFEAQSVLDVERAGQQSPANNTNAQATQQQDNQLKRGGST